MHRLLVALLVVGCGSAHAPRTPSDTPSVPTPTPTNQPPPAVEKTETVSVDTQKTTFAGNSFTLPKDWSITVKGNMTILEPPERDSKIALIDLEADSSAAARELAWRAYKPDHAWKPEGMQTSPPKDGWSEITQYSYQTSPSEQRIVIVATLFANATWTAVVFDVATATASKRGSQIALALGSLLPKGGKVESFAGKQPHPLDQERIAQLTSFVEESMKALDVPGVSLGLIANGKVVFSGGFGVRTHGKPEKVDGDTRYMIASNTKALTTLMLAKLVDAKRLSWDQRATSVLPAFKLGDPDTTSKVQIKHLICACTGMPRRDLDFLFEFQDRTPATVLADLATMHPTTKFGELYQYSNLMAAAGGFLGGHVAFPNLELGKAYDEAMRTLVFEPLGMKATTLDHKRAQSGNYATPHTTDLDGKTVPAVAALNAAVVPVRPAGAAWSTVNDLLRYVAMELAEGKLADGSAYIGKDALLARRASQVATGKDGAYGMGLMVDTQSGVTIVHHGGDLFGFHSDMLWLPELGIGAVILTNSDTGGGIRDELARRLLEVLFDGKPEAVPVLALAKERAEKQRVTMKTQLTIPADPAEVGKLATAYTSPALGRLAVVTRGGKTRFDFGEFQTEVATRRNPDGSISFLTISPGLTGLELVAGSDRKTLVLHDQQHEYVFTAR